MRRKVRATLSALAGAEVPDPGPGPFLQDFAAQCEALIETAPAVASTIMGLFPPEIVARLKARGIAWICNATTVAEARAAEAAGADAVVAQGAEAGGHRGTFKNAAAETSQVGLSCCCRRSPMRCASPSSPPAASWTGAASPRR